MIKKRGSTLFLRAAIIVVSLMVVLLCGLVIPAVYREWNIEFPNLTYFRYPALIGLIISALAFFVAAYQAIKLLGFIDKNKIFSHRSVRALRNIKYSAFVIGSVYAISMPVIYHIADQDDAPGLILIGLVFTCAPIVIGVFIAVAQRLLKEAIDMKSENDLTV